VKNLLNVVDLSVVVFGRTIFDRFSLTVGAGEIVLVVGPNGSGKSTLFDVVAGVRPPLRGSVTVAGIDAERDRRGASRSMGYAADRPELPSDIRVDEWLGLVSALRGTRHEEALAAFDVSELRGQPLGKLSLGETRRVLLASAFVGAPPLLLLDEPTNGLDVARRAELERRIREHAVRGAVVVATHDRRFMRCFPEAKRVELGRAVRIAMVPASVGRR
jgi:ABC-2 type transport system ATP-binding protein